LKQQEFFKRFSEAEAVQKLIARSRDHASPGLGIVGLAGSAASVLAACVHMALKKSALFILPDRESAAYFFNDLENLFGEREKAYEDRSILFFPASYKKTYDFSDTDTANVLFRSEVVNRLASGRDRIMVVAYPEALAEKVVPGRTLKKKLVDIHRGDNLSVDFLLEVFLEYGFEQTDFVVEPGKFSIRGGIVDVFSFSNDYPYRIEVMAGRVESLRSFDPESQVSVKAQEMISILPDLQQIGQETRQREFLLHSMPGGTFVWIDDPAMARDRIQEGFQKAVDFYRMPARNSEDWSAGDLFISGEQFIESIRMARLIEFRKPMLADGPENLLNLNFSPQPSFNKNFDLLVRNLEKNTRDRFDNIILSDNRRQLDRIHDIFETLHKGDESSARFRYDSLLLGLHEGFIDHDNKLACYTDHQIFDRYHRFRIRDKFPGRQALSIKDLYSLKKGDYITHIDHGIGIFSGLEHIEVNGRQQEAIRLIYKDSDILYISIHSLHRISKYIGKEGTAPVLHRLGSGTWTNLKNKTKNKLKDIARDLIVLYARRKARPGFRFSPDTYLQNELEASFIFEDTPDQAKATGDVKADMETPHPMDRLICGDVGFGKTEVAIRAAFKAVSDSKQVAVLVPTTILALQHFYTFSERLKDFPCSVDYVSRFRSEKEKKEVFRRIKEGELDILIGTHRILSKDALFKDLGLLIVDEEQKFGVAAKERLKQMKTDVDTLTLTATPIPRTLQFSLMGARDLSLINTPPLNRYPILTELHVYNENLIRDAVMQEVSRGGQVFFVHNRVQNIPEIAAVIQRLCPDLRIAVGHGQLDGTKLEKIMVGFIHGEYDVLVSTTIIESGLDIPNANTIIINNAHHFGLSDLHQMRGRVGRTNKKAFCYLLTPPLSTLTNDARKRLRAIEEFSDLGSGFNISMRDLDIRGAGNILGAEQSGFISEIGFEMYQKILNEAMTELREKEFRNLYSGSAENALPARECILETDLELMLPNNYVNNIQERLNLYKDLDNLNNQESLEQFAVRLSDRFGPLPPQARGLMEAVRLRWEARDMGFEKIILKSGKFIGYFPQDQESPYFQSEEFGRVLAFAQNHHRQCSIREAAAKLSLSFEPVLEIGHALAIIREMRTGIEEHQEE
jgi:transcription-repair coupling factor (superfamily II helicase)